MSYSRRSFSHPTPNHFQSMGVNIRKSHEQHLLGRTWSWVPLPKTILLAVCSHCDWGHNKNSQWLFRKAWWLSHLHGTFSFLHNKQASLSLLLSFSVSPGCFASILCCLLQICREEIGRPHLTLRVNDKSNNSMNSFVISNTILW